ncbi:MAG: GNAT family N-acetyltransferase [Planctomycetota bacterium]
MADDQASADLTVRRYRAADHDAVWAVHNLALHQVGAHVGNGPWDDDLHHIEEVYFANGGEFLVGECDGRVVAMGALRRVSDAVAKVTRMRVHPAWQRRGFGAAILRRLERRGAELGYRKLVLETTVGQTAAQALYRNRGFVEVGHTRLHGFDVILFEKTLPIA